MESRQLKRSSPQAWLDPGAVRSVGHLEDAYPVNKSRHLKIKHIASIVKSCFGLDI